MRFSREGICRGEVKEVITSFLYPLTPLNIISYYLTELVIDLAREKVL